MPNRPEVLTEVRPLEWVLSDQKEITHPPLRELFEKISAHLTRGFTRLDQAAIRLYLAELFCVVTHNPTTPNLKQFDQLEYKNIVAIIPDFDAIRLEIIKEIRLSLTTT